ncbi:MAG: amino acid adenylation domain-containing protein, partial [Herbaspirillum sp.]|nr:amino acid adenylation domain-containing protein [Herbaspirillum sp.]
NISESSGSLFCGIEYNTDIYSEDRILRMGEHLKTLISSVIKNPQALVKDLEIIPVEEKNILLNTFNDTNREFPREKTLIDLFEEQVCKTPDNIAVSVDGIDLTFRELNEKANIVGHYLRDNYAIKPDDLLGIMLERSERMVIGILGILKSGAAYVPIDPEYPDSRIDYIIQDTDLKIILGPKTEGFFIDIDNILTNTGKILNPSGNNNSNDLAYIMYTSGSTGNPKGIAIEHGSVINFLTGLNNFVYDNYTERLNIALFASFSWDGSIESAFSSLTLGHTLFIIPAEYKRNTDKLLTFYVDNSINITDVTPVVIDMFNFSISGYSDRLQLKELIVGGDALSATSIKRFLSYFPIDSAPGIVNSYGPTECCVNSSYYRVQDIDLDDSKILSIGKPALNVGYYIFDGDLNLSPLGCYGELYISGEGLAREYFNNRELTDERFIVNPVTNERMYRTGDVVRWLTDGNVEFLGRMDNQVKIRNFRIELGEIENTLIGIEEISSVAVMAIENGNGEKELAAYYVSEKEIRISDIRSFLKETLPHYMVPSYFIHMESFPLTSNGKLNRKALPEPDGIINTGIEYIAPRNV